MLQPLRTFVEVYRTRAFSAAARNLDLTQPAVSQHIASLEAQVGRSLFRRHARGVVPTAAADELAQQIGDGLDRAESALAMVRARSTHVSGTVHISAPPEFLAERVAPRMRSLTEAGVQLRMHLGAKTDLYGALLADEADLALTASTPENKRLDSRPGAREQLWAVAAPDVARLWKDTSWAEVPHLAYDPDRPLMRAWCAMNAVPLPNILPMVTAPDLRVIRAMVMAALGWSVLPDYLCDRAIEAGALVRLNGPVGAPENTFNLVWTKGSLRHPRVAFARRCLIEALAPLGAS